MSAEKLVCDLLAFLLGLFYVGVSLLGVFGTSPQLGSFGARVRYEKQVVMGGLLGVPNYLMIESVIMVVVAWGCLKCITFPPPSDHMPAVSLTLALAHCVVVLVYGAVSGVNIAYCIPVVVLTVGEASWRFARFLSPAAVRPVAIIAVGSAVLCLLAIYRMLRRKDERRAINERFLRKLQYLDKNPGASWELGKDAPNGFEDSETVNLLPT